MAGTRDMGITYGGMVPGLPGLMGWTDADYAACKDTRKSRSGFVYLLNGGAISWGAKQQPVVATSTAESEYVAAFTAAQEGVWLRRMCAELGLTLEGPLQLLGDNQAALAMAGKAADSPRTKHIDVRYHYLRDVVSRGAVKLSYTPSEENAADMFTKPLDSVKFIKFRKMIGVS